MMGETEFEDQLAQGEEVLWIEKPDVSMIFDSKDVFYIPLFLCFTGMSVYHDLIVGDVKPGILVYFVLLYFIFGRLFYKRFKKEKTIYAITNKRVVIYSEFLRKTFKAQFIDQFTTITHRMHKNGAGNIILSNKNAVPSYYWALWQGNLGFDWYIDLVGWRKFLYCFYDVPNADKGVKILRNIMNENNK